MNAITIQQPDGTKFAQDGALAIERAESFAIVDVSTHATAQEMIRETVLRDRAIQELFAEPKTKAFQAHKSICAAETKLRGPFLRVKDILSSKSATYERIEREKAAAEARRIEAERIKAAEDVKIERAIEFQDAGMPKTAERELEMPVKIERVVVAPEVAKVAGVVSTTRWKADVREFAKLVAYCASNPQFLESYLEASMPSLNKLAQAVKKEIEIVPGVWAVSESGVTVRK